MPVSLDAPGRGVYFRGYGQGEGRSHAIPTGERSIAAGLLRSKDCTPGPSAGQEVVAAARDGAHWGCPQSSSCVLLVAGQIRWTAVATRRSGSDSTAISRAF